MATAVAFGETIDLSGIAANVDMGMTPNSPRKYLGIKFFAGADDDLLVVRDGSATGPRITSLLAGDGEGRVDMTVPITMQPYIVFSECVLSAGHFVSFVVEDYQQEKTTTTL